MDSKPLHVKSVLTVALNLPIGSPSPEMTLEASVIPCWPGARVNTEAQNHGAFRELVGHELRIPGLL